MRLQFKFKFSLVSVSRIIIPPTRKGRRMWTRRLEAWSKDLNDMDTKRLEARRESELVGYVTYISRPYPHPTWPRRSSKRIEIEY
ncbi:hypothetical protein BDY19DRAFT_911296 [Irpex rosettiformis]|uniref:Uncharacterized protein n=1 Tax=Irpex rosettiformis TaxID=378272 RepID=A0ACB8UIQ9_9APHY|nr:hypothetical protein BDY19DRAFT_911296 [Irpex rosettiformis]